MVIKAGMFLWSNVKMLVNNHIKKWITHAEISTLKERSTELSKCIPEDLMRSCTGTGGMGLGVYMADAVR